MAATCRATAKRHGVAEGEGGQNLRRGFHLKSFLGGPRLVQDTNPDYRKPTEGNAKQALVNLLMIAVAVPPDAICEVEY